MKASITPTIKHQSLARLNVTTLITPNVHPKSYSMITGIIDKIVFAALLLALFQLPILADHYHQYLQGYVDAGEKNLQQITQLAEQYHYPNVQAMLDEHQRNSTASVRADAQLKLQQIDQHRQAQAALAVFEHQSLWQQTLYMGNPTNLPQLKAVLQNFAPGIPLTPRYLLLCVVVALAFNLLAALPLQLARRFKHKSETRRAA